MNNWGDGEVESEKCREKKSEPATKIGDLNEKEEKGYFVPLNGNAGKRRTEREEGKLLNLSPSST